MGRSLLLITGGMVFIFGMIQFNIIQRQKAVPVRTNEYFTEQQAKNTAVSMVEIAIEQIKSNPTWTGGYDFDEYLGGEGFVRAYTQNSQNIPDSNNVGSWDEYKVLLYSEVEYEGKTIETEVLVQRDAYSKYSYFTEREGDNIYFFSGDQISGPVHTNGTMNIAGEPVFNGMVTSPNMWRGRNGDEENPQGDDNNPQFLGGSDFSTSRKDPPDPDQVDRIKNAAKYSGGLHFETPITVEFYADGTVDITEKEWDGDIIRKKNYNLEHYNGVISSENEVETKGTIKGQVTLHSEDDIRIIGDLEYNTDPRTDSTSTDLLGLVSEDNIVVDEDAHRDNGNRDLKIHASLMALNESFYVEDWNEYCSIWENCSRGEIELLGGIVQMERGAVGTFSGNSVRTGYSKSYEYDERLLEMIPPSYPRERWFSLVYWRDRTN